MSVELKDLQGMHVKGGMIREAAKAVLDHEKVPQDAEVSIALVENKCIRDLNLRYRGIDEATDVLTFNFKEGDGYIDPNVLGEVIISVERAVEQARDFSQPLEVELMRLTIHGVLHLLGYGDENAKERERMHHRQEEILSQRQKAK